MSTHLHEPPRCLSLFAPSLPEKPGLPTEPIEPDRSGDPDELQPPPTDDADWDVFIADDDGEPLPAPGDFWIEDPDDDTLRTDFYAA